MKQYANKDKRIKYIRQENSGPSHARNAGACHSKCKYITFIDDDDITVPKMLEKQFKFMEHNLEIDACTSMQEIIDLEGKNITYQTISGNILPRDKIMLKHTFTLPFVLGASSLIRREAFDACSGFRVSPIIVDDLDFTLRFQERFSAVIMGEYLYKYTLSDVKSHDSVTTSDPVHYMKSYIISYLSAWCRRNTNSDPVEENKSFDEIIMLISELPHITRKSIFILEFPELCHRIIRSIKNGKYISDEEFTSTIKIVKYIAPKRFARQFADKLQKAITKKLIKQGKLIQAFSYSRIKT